MPGKPPRAREGSETALAGRRIVAGVAPFGRTLSPRASDADIWNAVVGGISEPYGFNRLEKLHRTRLDPAARERLRAFVGQAHQYYSTISALEPVAKPLVAYYFALNLTKAYLTMREPQTTTSPSLYHGLKESTEIGVRYSFKRERFTVQKSGVFRLLAERTGMKHCWADGYRLALHELMPYLPDGFAAYSDANAGAPKLLPVESVEVMFGKSKTGWLRIEVDRNVLRQRNIGPERLLREARVFGDRFRLVASDRETASYESKSSFEYGKKRSEVLGDLCDLFDSTVIATDRSFPGTKRYLVLSERVQLLSHEAVTFAVLHHLSNLVRYRPQDGGKILGSRHSWLLTGWVDRAVESFLMNMASRMSGEEHVLS